jgi:gas vesicle protein
MDILILIGIVVGGVICFICGALVGSNNAKKTAELAAKAKAEVNQAISKVK